jgi:hypothetical protein
MWQLIILGYVPGTDIQIGFDSLIRMTAIVAVIYLTARLIDEQRFDVYKTQESINQKAL